MSIPFGELRSLVQDPNTTPEALVYACLMAPMGQGETWVEYAANERPTFLIHKSDVSFHDIYAWGLGAAVMLADHFGAPGHACALFGLHAAQLIRRGRHAGRRATIAWGSAAVEIVTDTYTPKRRTLHPSPHRWFVRCKLFDSRARLDSRSANMTMPPTHLYTMARTDYSRRFTAGGAK